MKTFIIGVKEVHIQPVRVEADSREEAIKKVAEGEGETLEELLEYDYTLEPDVWTAQER